MNARFKISQYAFFFKTVSLIDSYYLGLTYSSSSSVTRDMIYFLFADGCIRTEPNNPKTK